MTNNAISAPCDAIDGNSVVSIRRPDPVIRLSDVLMGASPRTLEALLGDVV
jgi:hypothetical protein